jgi:hypothetical protein
MKRHIEEKELLVLFFTAYFLYGRNKYGDLERGDIRLARIAACRGVMHICDAFKADPKPLPRARFEEAFALLERQSERLADGTFKSAYLETLAALRKKADI